MKEERVEMFENGLYTAFGLQKPYVMHNLVGEILVVVVDDSGGKSAILHR